MLSLVSSRSHEEMSLKMIDHIVDEHNIEIDSEILKKAKVTSLLNRHSDISFYFSSSRSVSALIWLKYPFKYSSNP